ncbi:DoxX family protein [Glaciihabitans sp. dw_435]|uniref:DoxX family protein n=1 Tax=Glaciihabitans sp. dw_435 TaxID=2720081 RepID=UPI001BD4408C|nr:DoxX family protein [Glaciihabitans sp. dw_435]
MHIAALTLSVLLALVMLGSGMMKLVRAPRIVTAMAAVHVTPSQMSVLGIVELLATVGLIAGIWLPPIGLAAAIGTVLYFAGAILAHLRAHDPDRNGAIAFLALAAATLTLIAVAS